jgi:hypothetical protein
MKRWPGAKALELAKKRHARLASFVIAGLDPAIHPLAKRLFARR